MNFMKDLKALVAYMLEHKIVFVTTAAGMTVGAFGGVMAYYGGWLG